MSNNTLFQSEVQQAIVAGIMMAVGADQGRNVEFLRGVAAMGRHQAAVFGLDWEMVLDQARVQEGLAGLLDTMKTIDGGG